MNRSSAVLLLCVVGAAAGCSQGDLTPTPGGTAGAAPGTAGAPGAAGTSTGAAGAPQTGTAGATSGGAPGTAGSDPGTAGAPPSTGGTVGAAGASTGTAGAGTAGAGTAGSTGTAGGGGVTVESIVPTLDNFFWLGKCEAQNSTTKDCPVASDVGTACKTAGTTDWFSLGAFRVNTHKVGGVTGQKYIINFDARGMTGGKHYDGGTRQDATSTMYNQTGNDGWEVGGTPSPTKWNTYEIHVTPPVPGQPVNNQALTCDECPKGPDNVYYTNSFAGAADGTHEVFPVKISASFPVLGGGTIYLVIHDSNCLAQQNCGTNTDPNAMCDMPRAMDLGGFAGVPPAGFAQPYVQMAGQYNWHPQWLLFDVKSITQ